MLPTFGTGQPLRIHDADPKGNPDGMLGLLHGGKECRTGILHQVPAVGDLSGLRAAFSGGLHVARTAVARDDLDRWVFSQPGGDRCRLTIGQ
jgi:hypothetical protein